jgi:ABC-type amino acid transport substrate-binding protein
VFSRSPRSFVVARAFVAVVALGLVAPACARGSGPTNCTGAEAQLRSPGMLTVASDLTYPPFAYDRPDKIPAGFEADLVRALAKDLKLDVLIVNRATSAVVPGLLAHRHDIAAAGLHDTEELRGLACLSSPYLDADLGVLVPSPDPHAVSEAGDLDGRPVGVLDGSNSERWAREHLLESKVVAFPADADLLAALEDRRVDGVIEELPAARYATTQSRRVAVAAVIETDEQYVLAAAPDNGALIARLDRALAKLETSGRLAKLKTKWFGS